MVELREDTYKILNKWQKRYLHIQILGIEQNENNEIADQRGLEEVLSFLLKKDTTIVMDDSSLHKIDIVKDKSKEYKAKISTILGWFKRYIQTLNVFISSHLRWVEEEIH